MSLNPSLGLRSINVLALPCETAGIGRRTGWSAPGRAAQRHPQLIQRCAPLLGQRPIPQRTMTNCNLLQRTLTTVAAEFDRAKRCKLMRSAEANFEKSQ